MNIIYLNTTEKRPSGGAKIIYRHSDIINNLGIKDIKSEVLHIKKSKISKFKMSIQKILKIQDKKSKIRFFLESVPIRPFMIDDKVQLSETLLLKTFWKKENLILFNSEHIIMLEAKLERIRYNWFESCNGYHFSPEQLLILLANFNSNELESISNKNLYMQFYDYLELIKYKYIFEAKLDFGITSNKNFVKKSLLVSFYKFILNIEMNLYIKSLIVYIFFYYRNIKKSISRI